MNDYLGAVVPRRLRVSASVQLAGMRVPARAFLMTAGLIATGGIAITLGADIERAIWSTGGLILGGLLVTEGRLWGRSSREVITIVWRHMSRRQRLRLARPLVTLPPEPPVAATVMPRPRWQQEEQGR
ncbi:MAG: hypothetical protein HXY39_07840 [Chloroflexi bacterium]|nr:hypothetical protein [Chloroflexota bacterium]